MPSFQLTPQAAQLLGTVQRQSAPISRDVEQAIVKAAEANEQKPLTAAQLEQVLTQAMPAQSQLVKDANQACSCYHPDGKNPKFLTQILGHTIEKERSAIYNTPTVVRP